MKKTFNTTVSVKEGASRNVLRGIIQYDTLNEVNIRLSDGSKAFDYTGYDNIVFKVLKADGTSYIDSEGERVIATSPADGVITMILSGQATAAAGLCQSVIEVYSAGEKMTTARFNYEVFEALEVDEDAAASEPEYPVLQNLVRNLSTLGGGEDERVQAENARIYAENLRAAAENERIAAENARKEAEIRRENLTQIVQGFSEAVNGKEASGTAARLINRTTAVNAADSNYTTLMARGMSLNSSNTNPAVNGAIAWTYK